jgi:serine/threonine protein kinase/HEAT repeat protein
VSEQDPLIGVQLKHFRIERLIAEGGMGLIYQATHTVIGRKAAIKVLTERYSSDKNMIKRLHREARAVNRIGHPNIVDIFDFGQTPDNREYFVMEYLPGQSLAQIQEKHKRLPWRLVAPLLQQTLDALAAAHDLGIVHRDIKPENILIVPQDQGGIIVKVLDFGIAKSVGLGPEGERLTRAGSVMGTPEYISPEQIRGREVDGRADLYAVGAILFEMVMGRRPFESDKVISLLMMHLRDPVPSMDEIPAELGIPKFVPSVVNKAMAKDPNGRYPDARTMARALGLQTSAVAPSDGTRPLPELFWEKPEDQVEDAAAPGAPMGTRPSPGIPSGLISESFHPTSPGPAMPTDMLPTDLPARSSPWRWVLPLTVALIGAAAIILFFALRPPKPTLAAGTGAGTGTGTGSGVVAVAPKDVDLPALADNVRRVLRVGLQQQTMPEVRRLCTQGIAALRDSDALPLITSTLKQDPDRGVRSGAAMAIANLADASGAEALREARSQSDEAMKVWMNDALMRLGQTDGREGLHAALKSESKEIRFQAALALSDAGDQTAMSALTEQARQSAGLNRETLMAILGALAKLGHEDSQKGLIAQLSSRKDPVVTLGAAEALARLGNTVALGTLKDLLVKGDAATTRLVAAKILASLGDYAGLDALVKATQSPEEPIRRLGAEGLGSISDKASLGPLAAVLEDQRWSVKATAAESLARILGQMPTALINRSQDWVKTALANRDWSVRHAAIDVTSEMDPEVAISLLGWAFRDKDARVRAAAVATLERLKSVKAVPLLTRALSDASPDVRARAASALGSIKDKEAAEALQNAVGDESQTVRAAIAGSLLAQGNTKYVNDLKKAVKARDAGLRRDAVTALGKWKDPEADAILAKALKDKSAKVRFAAALALARRGNKAGLPVLRKAIGQGEEEEERQALQGMAALGTKPTDEVQTLARGKTAEARRTAMESAALLERSAALALLKRGVGDADPQVRRAAAMGLSQIAGKEAETVPMLRTLSRDSDPAVRAHASLGLAKAAKARSALDAGTVKTIAPAPLPPPVAPTRPPPGKTAQPKPLFAEDTDNQRLYNYHVGRAQLALQQGRYDVALSNLKQAQRQLDQPGVLFELGDVYFKMASKNPKAPATKKHLAAAKRYYEQYLQRAPAGVKAQDARGGLRDVKRLSRDVK